VFVARRGAVATEKTEALLQAVIIFGSVFHGEFAPITGHVTREEFHFVLSGLFERGQSARGGDQTAQVERWFIGDFLHELISPSPDFAFAVRRRGGRPRSKKQMPSWPDQTQNLARKGIRISALERGSGKAWGRDYRALVKE
jgi:hypothetical protein